MPRSKSSRTLTRRDAIKGIALGSIATTVAATSIEVVRAEAPREVDVVVIGAGAAGSMAARNLMRAGKSVVLLEANDRVGGRLKRGKIAGQDIDLGGQWVGPSQTRALEVTKELGIKTYPTYVEGVLLAEAGGQIYRGLSLPTDAMTEYFKVAKQIDDMSAEVSTKEPWKAPKAAEWDAMTAATWIRDNVRTVQVRDLLRAIIEAVFSVDPTQLSFLEFLFYIRSGNGFNDITGTQNGAQQDLFIGGYVSVPEKLAASLGDRLVLGSPVRAITQDDHGVTVRADKGEWRAQRVVITAPPTAAARIEYSPTLPYKRRGLMERMPMGAVIKCFIAYDAPFWRADGLNGQSISASAEFGTTFDITAPGNKHGILCGFFDGGPAIRWADKSEDERKAQVIQDIARTFGDKAKSPIKYVEQVWPREPWSIGGYTSVPGPGVLTFYGDALRQPCGRIHWAGTETAEIWSGYVDGALRSGDRVAEEVLAQLKT